MIDETVIAQAWEIILIKLTSVIVQMVHAAVATNTSITI